MSRNWIPRLQRLDQLPLAPNDVNSARWQCLCPRCLGFIFVQLEEVVTHHPFTFLSSVQSKDQYSKSCFRSYIIENNST